jgi:hypothetical protein
MPDPALNIGEYLTRIGLIPAPVQVLGRNTELDNEIARKVFRLDLAPFLPPQSEEGSLVKPSFLFFCHRHRTHFAARLFKRPFASKFGRAVAL